MHYFPVEAGFFDAWHSDIICSTVYCMSVNLQFAKLEYAYIRNVTVVPYIYIYIYTYIHIPYIARIAVPFMWGSLRLAPINK